MRPDDRRPEQLRSMNIETGFNIHTAGSCLFSMGNTRIHCTASVSEDVPRWLRESGRGWVTAEYRMLPGATDTRSNRETRGVKGRTAEIQRLIGRSLRAAVDLEALGPRQITIDCDVLQADGGTRTASICAGFVALAQALQPLRAAGAFDRDPLVERVAAVSLGLLDGDILLDLEYVEDSRAGVDLNLVMTGRGGIVEIQGTAEGQTMERTQLNTMLDLGWAGIQEILTAQETALPGVHLP